MLCITAQGVITLAPPNDPRYLRLMRFFDPEDDLLVVERRLPHWAQDGVVVFITWRTQDSLPKAVLQMWLAERDRWLTAHGIDPNLRDWKLRVQQLASAEMREFHDHFTTRWHDELDAGHGACVLRRSELSEIVASSLRLFDGERYEMLDFVVMPNHVHLLAVFSDKAAMLKQCGSWKHYTAREINVRLGLKGRFWQQDAFDHLVRHEAQLSRLRQYIAENPIKARLLAGEYSHYSTVKHHAERDDYDPRRLSACCLTRRPQGSSPMSNVVSIHPYFKVHPGQMAAARALLPIFIEKTRTEPKCLYYEFTVNGDIVFCREGYEGAAGALAHLANVSEPLGKMLELSELLRLEIHGPAAELERLKQPLASLKVDWFVYECGMPGR
jgi:type I restriction enzyme R subunit